MSESRPEAIPEEELAAIIAAAILDGKGGRMSRDAEGYLAGVCAEYLVDRLALAGVVAVRDTRWIGGGDGGTDAAASVPRAEMFEPPPCTEWMTTFHPKGIRNR
jgi:hypothetical protein